MRVPSQGLHRYLRTNAIQKGLFGRSPMWMGVLGIGIVAKGVGRITKTGKGQILFSESLENGATFEIVHMDPPPTRAQRRKARKASP
jgi:hypothetical protein